MSLVVLGFVAAALRYVFGQGGWDALLSTEPFYNPARFELSSIATATSLAALTYIGFDGITTLAEEVRNPRRTVPLATVLVCLITGLLSTLEVYLAQRAWPDYASFPEVETAFLDITARVGGGVLFQSMAAVLVIACFGSGLAGQAGAARLLFGMARDRVLPRRLFAHVNPRSGSPDRNVVFLGAMAFAGAATLRYEFAAELLNFGAFLAFMGVNLAAVRSAGRVSAMAAPALGFLFSLSIWLSLPAPAKIAGGAWFLAGILYSALRTRFFRLRPAPADCGEA
jgi:amino acid transporter